VLRKRLGKQIQVLRRSKGITQLELAEKSNYSVEFISLVERGINCPSIEGCQRIASALNSTLSELFRLCEI